MALVALENLQLNGRAAKLRHANQHQLQRERYREGRMKGEREDKE